MKRIVRGNDFTMRIPVVKIVDGEKVAFPLPGCTDIVVRLCSEFRRLELAHTIDAKEDNVIVARVEGDKIPLGTYALEVRGKIFGNDWRSNEYEQVAIVDKNKDADTEFGETDEGENSVEMDTAVVILPPDRELDALVKEAQASVESISGAVDRAEAAVTNAEKAVREAENVDIDLQGADLEITRKSGEKKGFNLMLLKGDKGDAFTFEDFTPEQIATLQKPAKDAAEELAADVERYLRETEVKSVTGGVVEMEANAYYDITLASDNTLTLQATDDTTHAHDYEGGFDADDKTAPTVTWPEGVSWADMPTLKAAMHYEFSIRAVGGKRYGVVYAWEKA